jgi:hypothetical protein
MQTKTRQKRTAKSVVPKPRPSPRRSGQPIATSKGIAHITLAGGNVFADLGFSESEAANLKVRASSCESCGYGGLASSRRRAELRLALSRGSFAP